MSDKRIWLLFALGPALLAPQCGAGGIRLPKTGQIISYATGDDGAMQMGVAWPSPRFVDHGDGTVSDELTGLMWLKNADCILAEYPSFDVEGSVDGRVPWQDALNFVNGMNAGNYPACSAAYTDWRVPNVKELRSLIDYSRTDPALPSGHPFVTPYLVWFGGDWTFWTSSTYAAQPANAWVTYIQVGTVTYDAKYMRNLVWPVRTGKTADVPAAVAKTGQTTCYDAGGSVIPCAGTGQDGDLRAGVAWPSPRFAVGADLMDGCVTDNLTGLIWTRSPASELQTWSAALAETSGSSFCGRADWRLPNVNELESLLNAEEPVIATWLSEQGFASVDEGVYWASTTPVCPTFDCTNIIAWAADLTNAKLTTGWIVGANKSTLNHTWLVSGGG